MEKPCDDTTTNNTNEDMMTSGKGRRRRKGTEVTSTYRAMYGGPEGTSSWTSSSKTKYTEDLARMLEEQGRVTERDVQGMPSSSSLNKALKDISVLTTGQILKHRDAMESLVDIVQEENTPGEMMREIHLQGGTHVLYTNIQSSDKAVRTLAATGLVCICTHEKEALREVVSSRDISSSIVGICVRDVLTSQSMIHRDLFDLLIESKSRTISQCCAEHRVVLKCIERLQSQAQKHGKIDTNALHMLSTMVGTGLEYYLDSVYWNGGLEVFPMLLSFGVEDESIRESIQDVAMMTSAICRHNPDAAESLCTPLAVEYLSYMVADPDVSLNVQVAVARVLLEISRVSKKKEEVVVSLQDYCLPRVCEVVHQSKQHEIQTEESDLWTTCAGIVSYLCRDSNVCCHVVIFHADILQQSIRLLTHAYKYEQTQVLLDSAMTFATCCSNSI